jgi:uncharacterized RDD family membrane protein YckC
MAAQYSRAVCPSDTQAGTEAAAHVPCYICGASPTTLPTEMDSPQDNPFAPTKAALSEPASVASEASPPTREMLASRWRRLVNVVVDVGGYFLLVVVVVTLIALVDRSFLLLLQGPAAIVFDAVMYFLYYAFFEFLTGRTPGKFLTGTRVVSDTGAAPTLGQVTTRSILRLIPLEAFTFFARGPGLHDRGSRTRVVLYRYVA